MKAKLAIGLLVLMLVIGFIGQATNQGPKIRANTDRIIASVDSLANLNQLPEDAYSLYAVLNETNSIPNNPGNRRGAEQVHFFHPADETGGLCATDISYAVTGDIVFLRTAEGYMLWQVVKKNKTKVTVLKITNSL